MSPEALASCQGCTLKVGYRWRNCQLSPRKMIVRCHGRFPAAFAWFVPEPWLQLPLLLLLLLLRPGRRRPDRYRSAGHGRCFAGRSVAGSGLGDGFADRKEALPDQTQKNDLVRISGSFAVVHFETDGQKSPEVVLKQMKVIQKEADWSFHQGGQVTRGRDTIVLPGQVAHIDCVYTEGGVEGSGHRQGGRRPGHVLLGPVRPAAADRVRDGP